MSDKDSKPVSRKRSVTSVALGWLAERLRKTEEIKAQVNSGTYRVDPHRVASAIIEPKKGST